MNSTTIFTLCGVCMRYIDKEGQHIYLPCVCEHNRVEQDFKCTKNEREFLDAFKKLYGK